MDYTAPAPEPQLGLDQAALASRLTKVKYAVDSFPLALRRVPRGAALVWRGTF